MQSYNIITAPATEPITLAEAKVHLRVTNTIEDALITALIVAARQWVENYSWRPLITQTLQANYDYNDLINMYGTEFLINKFPVTSITSIKYIDQTGTEQTISSGDYDTDLISPIARVKLASKPNTKDVMNALKIRFVAGYANAAAVPQIYKQAMYLIIGHMYDNKSEVQSQALSEIPFGVYSLLDSDNNKYFRTI
jgi:uncharacterized phiE125 gp8 family phage protein